MKRVSFSGEANETGFKINDWIHQVAVQTKWFKEEGGDFVVDRTLTILMILSPLIMVVPVIVICWIFDSYFQNFPLMYWILFGMLILACGITWFLTFLKPRYLNLKIAQMFWTKKFFPKIVEKICQHHACEHKLLNLLENGEQVTLETLQKISFISKGCGTAKFFIPQEKTLSEPTLEQYQETLRVAEEYFKKLKEKEEWNE